MLCDAKTGYVWNSILHIGKDTDGIEDGNSDYHAARIVFSLAKNFSTKGNTSMLTTGILQLNFAKY